MSVTLVLPPLTQLNTPYPSIAFLARALRERGEACHLRDLGVELALRVFSRSGLEAVFHRLGLQEALPEPAWRALALEGRHLAVIDAVVRFLQGRDRTLAPRIVAGHLLPQGPRLAAADTSRFGEMGVDDAARYLATLYLEDLADLVHACVDDAFELARYAHRLAVGPAGFDDLADRLEHTTLVDAWLDELADSLVGPDTELVGLSVPFPGTLYGALRVGRRVRRHGVPVVMGGGYVNTELREVDEPRLWDFVDALSYDDGIEPLLALLDRRRGGGRALVRTRDRGGAHGLDVPSRGFVDAAWYADLDLGLYLQVLDTLNPAHRLWSDGRWNKIVLAHGCYWRRCAFCDVSLDYVRRYEPARVESLVDRVEALVAETGTSGFHLVDEAAPPRLLRDFALAVLRRGLTLSWWGNIRFEEAFTPDLCRLLAASGLVAVTGGLEVASDRLLALMDKGVTIEQAARACRAFQDAGVLVHAYLMYGFPTETLQESVDAMEVVRQIVAAGLVDSAFWHRFVLTRHSLVVRDPARWRITVGPGGSFAANDLPHDDLDGADHDRLDEPLAVATAAWMRGEGLDQPVESWFVDRVPRSREPADRVARALREPWPEPRDSDRLVWLGGAVLETEGALVLHHASGSERVGGTAAELDWLGSLVEAARPEADPTRLGPACAAFPGDWRRFRRRWTRVRRAGMVAIT